MRCMYIEFIVVCTLSFSYAIKRLLDYWFVESAYFCLRNK